MNYIDEIFTRANIQQIREFLMHGVDCVEVKSEGYLERLEKSYKPVNDIIYHYFPERKENDKIMDRIGLCLGEAEDVYMEIGLQCGFILAMQIISNTKNASRRKTMRDIEEQTMKD